MLSEYLKVVDELTIDNSKRLQRENEMLKVAKSEYDYLKQQAEETKAFTSGLYTQIGAFQKEIKAIQDKLGLESYGNTKHVPTEDELKYEAAIHELLSNPMYDHSHDDKGKKQKEELV